MATTTYLGRATVELAIRKLFGTADHLLKIWFTLKQMGMADGAAPVLVTTSSPDDALQRLFSFGSPAGELFVPFAHTPRFMKMQGDAGRSIIQTTIQRWKTSGSVVTCDPTAFLDIDSDPDNQLFVRPGRSYPLGLGWGKNGFALADGTRVSLPSTSFACWYYRQSAIESTLSEQELDGFLVGRMREDLNISPAEFDAIRADAQALGFAHVEAGPLVRSSYHARDQVPGAEPAQRQRPAPPLRQKVPDKAQDSLRQIAGSGRL